MNKLNPLALVINGISGYATGEDSYGVPTSNVDATVNILSAIPITKAAGWLSGTSANIVKNVAVNAAKTGVNLTKSQLRSISSLEKQIAKHRTKLAEYIKDPIKFDNKGFLKNAPNDAVRQNIIQSRIDHLNREIQGFQTNIQKILKGE